MKLIFIICMMPFFVHAQLSYVPVIVSQCSGEETGDFYAIIIEGKGEEYRSAAPFDNEPELKIKSVQIKDTGTYHLTIATFGDLEVIKKTIVLNEFKTYRDTFNTKSLVYNFCICSPPAENYFLCGEDPDGLATDYYFDGSIRAQGTFNNGYIKDSLIEYFRNGTIKSMEINLHGTKKLYGKPYNLREAYDFYKDGTPKRHYNNKKGFIKRYYENGKLKEHHKMTASGKTKNYYESGQMQSIVSQKSKKKVCFSENGKRTHVWKRKWYGFDLISSRKERGSRKVKLGEEFVDEIGSDGFPISVKF